ncbi:MAG: MFS transporter [Pirellulaceae bacterium]
MNAHYRARQKVRQNLICSTYEGSCYSLMVGLSETYFSAFYIAVGMAEFEVGLLASVPYLLGSMLQLLTPWGVRKVGSYRVWTIWTAAIQGSSLLLLSLFTLMGWIHFYSFLMIAGIYWASGLATSPAWNTWIEFVVPRKVRARYFSVRMRIRQLSLLIAIAAAGFTLRGAGEPQQQLFVFAGMFAVAGIMRLMSSNALSHQIEHNHWLRHNLQAASQTSDGTDIGKLISSTLPFFAAMQFAVYISGPYFAPFMLRNLELSYLQYMGLVLLGYFGRVLAMPFAGKFAKEAGPGKLMLIGALGIIPMSSLWWFHSATWPLYVIQTCSGAAWGCYELAMSLVFIERIPGHHRMRVLSWFNTFNGIAMVGGSVLGGLLIREFERTTGAFMFVFTLSGIARIAAMVWFPYWLLKVNLPTDNMVGQPVQVSAPMLNGRTIVRPFHIPEPEPAIETRDR